MKKCSLSVSLFLFFAKVRSLRFFSTYPGPPTRPRDHSSLILKANKRALELFHFAHDKYLIFCRNGISNEKRPIEKKQKKKEAMGTQHYSLRWNNHQSHVLSAFDALLQNESLVDCTLVCEDTSVRAHKVVLSACR